MCATTLHYRKAELYKYRSKTGYPPANVISKLKELHLFRNRSRRQGRQVLKNIPVHTTHTKKVTHKVINKPVIQRQYIEVPRQWYNLPSLLLSNVTSLNNKMEEVIATVTSTNADVVAITEAWQMVPEACNITNYQLFHHLRTGKRGGGLALYCRSSLHPSRLPITPPQGVETLWVRLSPSSHPRHAASLLLCLVYHPPRASTAATLVDHIIENMDEQRTRYPSAKVIVCGDFNHLDTSEIEQQLNITQIVDFPTHGSNTLDLIMTDLTQHYLPPQPLPPMGRSPHLSIIWTPTPTTAHPTPRDEKAYRPLTDSAKRLFAQWVFQHQWNEVLEEEDVHKKWKIYTNTIMAAYHHFFAEKTRQVHPSDAPWVTPRIKRLLEQRYKAFYTNTSQYKSLRNKVIREIKLTKATHYQNKIHGLKQTNICKWYSKIKDVCGLSKPSPPVAGVSHLPPQKAAEEINNYLANICQSLPALDRSSLPAYLPASAPLPLVQESEVIKALLKLRSKRSTTPIDLPITLYQEFAPELATPLCSILNASFSQNQCPADWKTAYVTPVPKTTNPQSLNDIRPISITPIPSLLCEDFIFKWTYTHLAPHIDPQQFGNVKSSSTTHCLIDLLDFVHRNLDKRKTSVALAFIDFRKAFDLVHHNTVISKAIKLLPHNLVSWLADFLSDRRQVVRYQGKASTPQPLTCGVPQGTKMGPLCFLLLINDAMRDTPSRWKYVDDTTLGVTLNNNNPDYTPLQTLLDTLHTWTTHNHITINTTKSTIMHINTSSTTVPPPRASIGNNPLQVVQSTKLLGVTIDHKLTWKEHVAALIKSATYKLYLLRRLKTFGTPAGELASVYSLFILPKLTYASPAWASSLTLTQRRQLEKVQKRACRLILGAEYTGYQDALSTLHLTTLQDRHSHLLQQFSHKLLTHPRHRHLLPPPAPRPRHSVRHSNTLMPIRARTDRYANSAVPAMTKLINK